MRHWMIAMLIGLLAWLTWPTQQAQATSVEMHVGTVGEVVQCYDVTAAWQQHAPQGITATEDLQAAFAAKRPASAKLVATAHADSELVAHFNLAEKHVYWFDAALDEQVVVVPITTDGNVAIWPKEVSVTPLPPSTTTPPDTPKPSRHPNLPDTGETVGLLSLLGGMLLMIVLIVKKRTEA